MSAEEKSGSYSDAKSQLDEIAERVKGKDLPLEKALDLYEEAIRIGNECADLIDVAEFTLDEVSDEQDDKDEQDEAAGESAGEAASEQPAADAQPQAEGN